MYTKRITVDLFFGTPNYTEFFKNGKLIAIRRGDAWTMVGHVSKVELTRAQGYKYWERYCPNRIDWSLPQPLQDALEREPRTSGVFFDRRRGEWCGYEG